MSFIPYPLDTTSRLRVNWKVKLWDENGLEGEWSEPAFFEIGSETPQIGARSG